MKKAEPITSILVLLSLFLGGLQVMLALSLALHTTSDAYAEAATERDTYKQEAFAYAKQRNTALDKLVDALMAGEEVCYQRSDTACVEVHKLFADHYGLVEFGFGSK